MPKILDLYVEFGIRPDEQWKNIEPRLNRIEASLAGDRSPAAEAKRDRLSLAKTIFKDDGLRRDYDEIIFAGKTIDVSPPQQANTADRLSPIGFFDTMFTIAQGWNQLAVAMTRAYVSNVRTIQTAAFETAQRALLSWSPAEPTPADNLAVRDTRPEGIYTDITRQFHHGHGDT